MKDPLSLINMCIQKTLKKTTIYPKNSKYISEQPSRSFRKAVFGGAASQLRPATNCEISFLLT